MTREFTRLVAAAALSCLPAISIAASGDPKEIERLLARVRNEPIIFVLATGAPNACGRGCSEWIAGEGQFDESAAQRFRDFLAALPKRDLPIFFNSDGGLLREALQIGSLLRENRMSAGVARTVPDGCHLGTPIGDACRRLMQSKRDHKANWLAPRHAMWTQAPRFEFIPAWAANSTEQRIFCGATSPSWVLTRTLLMPRRRFLLAVSEG